MASSPAPVPRARLRSAVLAVSIGLAVVILLYSSIGDHEDPQAAFARSQQTASAQASQGDPEETRHQLDKQRQEALDQVKAARKTTADAKAAAKTSTPGADGSAESVADAENGTQGESAETDLDLSDNVDEKGKVKPAVYAHGKEAVAAARRAAKLARIVSAEWEDDEDSGSAPKAIRLPNPQNAMANSLAAQQDELQRAMLAHAQTTLAGPQNGDAAPQSDKGNKDVAWLKQQEHSDRPVAYARAGLSAYMKHQYDTLPCTVSRKVNTDQPGVAECIIGHPIYDSITGRHVLIPTGTILRGPYSPDTAFGQTVILAAFTRMQFPNGATLELGASQGANREGASGLPAEINNHFWQQFGAGFLVAGLTSLVSGPSSTNGNNVVVQTGGSQGLQTAAGQVLLQVTTQMMARNQSIKPTGIAHVGDEISVVVARDLVIDPAIVFAPPPEGR